MVRTAFRALLPLPSAKRQKFMRYWEFETNSTIRSLIPSISVCVTALGSSVAAHAQLFARQHPERM